MPTDTAPPTQTIRAAYSSWPAHNRALRAAVAVLTDDQLAVTCAQRVFAHDVWHIAEINDVLACAGLPPIDIWT
jgi:hypothetical protein